MKTGIIGFINNSNTRIYNEVLKLQSLLENRYPDNFISSKIIYTKIIDLGNSYKMCREVRLIYDRIKTLVGSKCSFVETYIEGSKMMCKYTVNGYDAIINVGKFNNIVKVNKFLLHDFFIEDIQVIEIGHNDEIRIIKKSIRDMINL